MNINDLTKLGLTSGEIKLYYALLELGESTRTHLSKKSGISPSKIYDVANRLIEKGIISSVKKNGVTHFSAADPEKLKDYVLQKEEEIKKEKQMVDEILPELLEKYQKTKEQVDVEIFYGWDGLKTILNSLENSMDKKDECLIFGASIGQDPQQADIFFKQYQQNIDKRGHKVRIIFNEDLRLRKERHKYYDNHKLHEIKYLYTNTLTELYVYKKAVLILILLKKPLAINIKSKDAVDAFNKFFETMWKLAKK